MKHKFIFWECTLFHTKPASPYGKRICYPIRDLKEILLRRGWTEKWKYKNSVTVRPCHRKLVFPIFELAQKDTFRSDRWTRSFEENLASSLRVSIGRPLRMDIQVYPSTLNTKTKLSSIKIEMILLRLQRNITRLPRFRRYYNYEIGKKTGEKKFNRFCARNKIRRHSSWQVRRRQRQLTDSDRKLPFV